MSALPSISISPSLSNKWYTATRRLSDLLDILIAVRMDVGQSADEAVLASEKLRVIRLLLDDAIASAKEIFASTHYSEASRTSDIVQPLRRTPRPVPTRATAELGQAPL
jgi:hypothetical protein